MTVTRSCSVNTASVAVTVVFIVIPGCGKLWVLLSFSRSRGLRLSLSFHLLKAPRFVPVVNCGNYGACD